MGATSTSSSPEQASLAGCIWQFWPSDSLVQAVGVSGPKQDSEAPGGLGPEQASGVPDGSGPAQASGEIDAGFE